VTLQGELCLVGETEKQINYYFLHKRHSILEDKWDWQGGRRWARKREDTDLDCRVHSDGSWWLDTKEFIEDEIKLYFLKAAGLSNEKHHFLVLHLFQR
jgi:hypothetical protein